MNCLVTGGAGFIGSNLVDKLIEDNNVVVIDNFTSGKRENLAHHKEKSNFRLYKRDITSNLNDIFASNKIDKVFHLAAITSVPYSIDNPIETNKVNISGTLNLLEKCKKFGVERFIFSSSCAVYGDQDRIPFSENMEPNPISPYALTKHTGEQYCRLFNYLHGLECISLRYFNVYGPRQDPNGSYAGLIPKFIKLYSDKKTPTIYGSGNQTRDFVFVSDVVNANIIASKTKSPFCLGEKFNIGTGKSISVNEVAKDIGEISGNNMRPNYGPELKEIKNALADTRRAKDVLNWESRYSFREGLAETYEHYIIKKL